MQGLPIRKAAAARLAKVLGGDAFVPFDAGDIAEGRERAAELSRKVRRTRHRLAVEKARLRRARHDLAARLVAIYESGSPSTADVVLGSGDYQELVTRTDYLRMISESDSALADRVAQVDQGARGVKEDRFNRLRHHRGVRC